MSGEADFIDQLRKIAAHPAARDLMDDAAVLPLGGETLILTHDMMAEDIHFLPNQDPADIAWKLVAANLSDLAAKGAEPLGVLLGFTLDTQDDRFIEGLREVLSTFDVPLLGGDTISSNGKRAYGLTAVGRATHVPVPSRSGAQPGNALFLTGKVGAAMMGFEGLRDGTGDESTAFRRPEPLLAAGQSLAPSVTAMMDVSDGLLLDALRMARASQVTLSIDTGAVPIGCPEGRRDDAVRWGDDYALLYTAPPETQFQVAATRIGTVEPAGLHPITIGGEPPDADVSLGYEHRQT